MSSKYNSRKFGLTIAVLLLASVFLTVGKLAGSEWVTVVIFVLGIYKAANVLEVKQNV